jgi:hypothetical protein
VLSIFTYQCETSCCACLAAEGDEAAAQRAEELILDRPRDRKRRVRFEDSYATGGQTLYLCCAVLKCSDDVFAFPISCAALQ